MSNYEASRRPHLEIVRNYEDLSEDEKVIEAYCSELLIDKDGKPRNFATKSRTPFASSRQDWAQIVFFRSNDSYSLTFHEEPENDPLFSDMLGKVVFEIEMRPYSDVYPGRKAPNNAKWYIVAGKPDRGAPKDYAYDPHYFREWLEETWGPLPPSVQAKLHIQQASIADRE